MLVRDIMTSPVVGIEASASIVDAAKLMLANRVSGLPVFDEKKQVVGVLTDSDFLRRYEVGTVRKRPNWLEFIVGPGRQAEEYVRSHGRRVKDVMSQDVISVSPETPLDQAVELMSERNIKRLPILDRGQLVGIVSRADLMRAMLLSLAAQPSSINGDDAIRRSILAELDQQSWSSAIRVNVDHRNVELSGLIFDERARQAAIVLAENTAGVRSVTDQLGYVEPISGLFIEPSKTGS